jgi:hypothetical protein
MTEHASRLKVYEAALKAWKARPLEIDSPSNP